MKPIKFYAQQIVGVNGVLIGTSGFIVVRAG
jgi:hypothetical protein